MKRLLLVSIYVITLIAFSNHFNEQINNQDVIICSEPSEITQIQKRMDRAKEIYDIEMFNELNRIYTNMNPAVEQDYEILPDAEDKHSEPLNSRWSGNDILINSYDYGIQGISMDSRNDNMVYLAVSRKEEYNDVNDIDIFYTYDGVQWYYLTRLFWLNHHLFSPTLKIVESTSTDYLFVSFHSIDTNTNNADVLLYRRNLNDNSYIYFYPANSSRSELHSSIDSDDLQYPSSPYIYMTFRTGDSVICMRSTDLGQNWSSRTAIATGTAQYYYTYPEIAYGWNTPADSFDLGVVFVYRTKSSPVRRRVRFRRNYSFGSSSAWLSTTYFAAPDNYDYRPSLKMTHGTMPSAAILFARRDTVGTDQEDLLCHYTYNGGRTWSGPATLYSGGNYNVLSDLSLDDSPGDYHAFFKGDYDDIRYKEAPYDDFSGGGWTMSIQIGDSANISETTYPASAVMGTQPCVAYSTYKPLSYHLMFDALWLQTGIEEELLAESNIELLSPTPFSFSGVRYFVNDDGPVHISIYDVSGRCIHELIDEYKESGVYSLVYNSSNMKSGVYFIRMNTKKNSKTIKINLLK